MQVRKGVITVALGLPVLIGCILLLWLPTPRADAQTTCQLDHIGQVHGTARLDLAAQHIDTAQSTSTVILRIQRSWPLAGDLFQGVNSLQFQDALNCLSPSIYNSFNTSASVTLSSGYVRVKLTSTSPIYDWSVYAPDPWAVWESHQGIHIAVKQREGGARVNWDSITVAAHGFGLTAPQPLPSSDRSGNVLMWSGTRRVSATLSSLTVVPNERMKLVFSAEDSENGQNIADDLERIAAPLAIALILGRRRRAGRDDPGPSWLTTRQLCFAAAGISTVAVLNDVFSWRSHVSSPFYAEQLLELAIIYVLFFMGFRKYRRRTKSLIVAITALSAGGFVSFLPWSSASGFVTGDTLILISFACILVVCCTVVLKSISALWPSPVDWRKPGPLQSLVAGLAVLSIVVTFAQGAGDFTFVFPMDTFITYLIPCGILVLLAKGQRPVSVLLGQSDRLLLALALGYVMLITGPQWYAGYDISIAGIVAFITSLIVLRIAEQYSIIKPLAGLLAGQTYQELEVAQGRLIEADSKVTRITEELEALGSAPLTNEQLERRALLQLEKDRLHRWPAVEDHNRTGITGRVTAKVRSLLNIRRRDEVPGFQLPEATGPTDIALALGPACRTEGNIRKTGTCALALALLATSYYLWRQLQAGPPHFYFLESLLSIVTSFWSQLLFWTFPLLMLILAWGSLAGRRGPQRSFQIWLCLVVPLAAHALINYWLDQSATLAVILQSAFLLIALVLLGLWSDALTIRKYRKDMTFLKLFRRYVQLNRLVATLALLLPLVTAGLTIWTQIENGQKGSPAQAPPNPTSSASSPASSNNGPSH